ncbi:MAG: hypothetical protein ACOX52_14330 [Verrucomicrobiota bacterium]|jgi:hypothetical protein
MGRSPAEIAGGAEDSLEEGNADPSNRFAPIPLLEVIRKGELLQAMIVDQSDLASPWTFSDGL